MKSIDPELVQRHLHPSLIQPRLILLDTIDSTNEEAKRLLIEGATEGIIVVAEVQTNGRGRYRRNWYSPEGGLYFSIILSIRSWMQHPQLLGPLCGCAVADGIEHETGVEASLKWPNDILVEQRKIGGILSELLSKSNSILGAIIGIGINVNNRPEEFPESLRDDITTLLGMSKKPHSMERLLATIINGIDMRLLQADKAQSFVPIISEWRQRLDTIGRHIHVELRDDSVEGFAKGLADDGSLLVSLADEQVISIAIGDVTHLR